jgi:hypothetical protein
MIDPRQVSAGFAVAVILEARLAFGRGPKELLGWELARGLQELLGQKLGIEPFRRFFEQRPDPPGMAAR